MQVSHEQPNVTFFVDNPLVVAHGPNPGGFNYI